MKKDFVMPIVVLGLICLVISGALAFTNNITEPVIEAKAAERKEAASFEIIPDAGGFEQVPTDGLPESVEEVMKAANGTGYVFVVTAAGYGGEMRIMCGIAPDGSMIRSRTLEQNETKGQGSKVTEEPFQSQFDGAGSGLEGVDAISGATISSQAYLGAIGDAFEAFEIVGGAG